MYTQGLMRDSISKADHRLKELDEDSLRERRLQIWRAITLLTDEHAIELNKTLPLENKITETKITVLDQNGLRFANGNIARQMLQARLFLHELSPKFLSAFESQILNLGKGFNKP